MLLNHSLALAVIYTCLMNVSDAFILRKPILVKYADLRIIGGNETIPNSQPHMVFLVMNVPNDPLHVYTCGGTLISRNYVLTAAHCVDGTTVRYMLFGAHNKWSSGKNQVEIFGGDFTIHEDFTMETLRHDIAVVKLPKPITLTKYIQLVNLPSKQDTNKTFVNETATAYGWGIIHDEPTVVTTEVLREVEIPVISNTECRTYNQDIYDEDLCTSGAGVKGTCEGDSGGPLMLNGIQIGITSRGVNEHCETSDPSVFSSVTHHLDWIGKHTDVKIK